MIILGLIDSKPSTAALLIDGKIASAISEERLCRMKMANGMPRQAISAVMEEAGIGPEEVDVVTVAQHALAWRPDPQPWNGWFQQSSNGHNRRFAELSSALAPIAGRVPAAWKAHHQLKAFLSRDRRKKLPELLRNEYGISAPIRFYDHHLCHATSAYFTSGFDAGLTVTLDGGGDGRSGSIYIGENGRLRPVASVDSFNSLGNFYSYITALCGFKAELHEGKVTGLAPLGQPIYLDTLREFIGYETPGRITNRVPMYYSSALKRIAERLPSDFDRADLAASVQTLLEEVGISFIDYWLRRSGMRHVAVAGGVFANVKFNQRVHELEDTDCFFVHPAMGDDGLAVGAAFAYLSEQPDTKPELYIDRLPNVYLGPEYDDDQIEKAISGAGYAGQYVPQIQEKIAELLAQGRVVARFTGRMEYGPRALGHRSILYQTTDPSVNDWLNDHLKRTEFMPFAPATLIEHARDCYNGIEGAEDPARFMTITFDCTEEMKQTSPGVVHTDGTARPQLIDEQTAPDFYKILVEYRRRTGIPSLINTSFNMHGEPIVCTPEDALRSFTQGNLEYLAIGNWLVTNKEEQQAVA